MDSLGAISRRKPSNLPPIIDEVVQALREAFGDRLHLIVLYGSYARGDATADSDVDLLLVADGSSHDTFQLAYDAINDAWFRHDCWPIISIHCVTPDHFEYITRIRTSFVRSLMREGIVLWTNRAANKSNA